MQPTLITTFGGTTVAPSATFETVESLGNVENYFESSKFYQIGKKLVSLVESLLLKFVTIRWRLEKLLRFNFVSFF